MAGLWVALEVTTILAALLVRLQGTEASLEAAWKYILIASCGLAIGLVGVIVLYASGTAVFGSQYAPDWSNYIAMAGKLNGDALRLAFLLALIGFGTKMGLAPMHTWLPDAHGAGPTPTSAMLSGVLLSDALYVIMRFASVANAALGPTMTQRLFFIVGLLSLFVGAFFLLRQRDIKRMLAYSSIEHMGIVACGLAFGVRLAVIGALLHVINHAATKALAFFSAGRLAARFGTREIAGITGRRRGDADFRHPLCASWSRVGWHAALRHVSQRDHDPGRRILGRRVAGGRGSAGIASRSFLRTCPVDDGRDRRILARGHEAWRTRSGRNRFNAVDFCRRVGTGSLCAWAFVGAAGACERHHWRQVMMMSPASLQTTAERRIEAGARLAWIFADRIESNIVLHYVLEEDGQLHDLSGPLFDSARALSPHIPAADWYERELTERFGIKLDGLPKNRPLTEIVSATQLLDVKSPEVSTVLYGPVRSGIVESARWIVETAGEDFIDVYPSMFFKHRGLEERFASTPIELAPFVAEHVSGATASSHAAAFCARGRTCNGDRRARSCSGNASRPG